MRSEIKIRGISEHKKQKLKEQAKQFGYTSLNSYLVFLLEHCAEAGGLTPTEKEVMQQHEEIAKIIERNTEAIILAIDYLKKSPDAINKIDNAMDYLTHS